jgi:hypothetical protein
MVDTPGEGVRVLEDALAGVRLPLTAGASDALRSGLCKFVDERRAAGWSVDRIVIAVKRAALDAGLADSLPDERASTQNEDALATMVRWCLDHYYAPNFGEA